MANNERGYTTPLVTNAATISQGYTRAVSFEHGGQQGHMRDPRHFMSSATYSRQKMHCVLLEAPTFMGTYMRDGAQRVKMLKAFVEVLPTSVTGLMEQIDVTYGEHKVGNAGEVHETPTQTARVRCAPAFVVPELEGRAFWNYFDQWIRELIIDPDTFHPTLINKASYRNSNKPEFLPDTRSMSCLFYEPSIDMSRITSAVICTNMMPKSTGSGEMKRVMGEANETVEHTYEFTNEAQRGDRVTQLAQFHLDSLAKLGSRPASLPAAFDAVESMYVAPSEYGGVGGEGYVDKLNKVAVDTPEFRIGQGAPSQGTWPSPGIGTN